METTPSPSSEPPPPPAPPTPATPDSAADRTVDYHLVRGALWGALLGLGVAIYLVLFAIVPFGDWLILGLTIVAGIAIGLLWARFAPPRQGEPGAAPMDEVPAPPTADEPAAATGDESAPAASSSDGPPPPPPPPADRDTT